MPIKMVVAIIITAMICRFISYPPLYMTVKIYIIQTTKGKSIRLDSVLLGADLGS